MEIFKSLKNNNDYLVSNYGNVMKSKTHTILNTFKNPKTGYHVVNIVKDKVPKVCYVHRLVASTFLDNYENKECVDHINGDIDNNRLDNLRYSSYQENQYNRKPNRNSRSGIKGVVYNDKTKKFGVYLRHNGVLSYHGSYANIEDAINKRKEIANELFGEYVHISEKIL
jgi:hypothetical protein